LLSIPKLYHLDLFRKPTKKERMHESNRYTEENTLSVFQDDFSKTNILDLLRSSPELIRAESKKKKRKEFHLSIHRIKGTTF